MENDPAPHDESGIDKPPILSSWNNLYAVVFLNLVAMIVLFSIFSRMFR